MPFNTSQEFGGSIAIKDEGITIAAKAASVNLVGSGVTGTALGSAVTATIPGGGSASLVFEAANETPDGNIVTFTFPHSIGVVFQNGIAQFTGAIGNLDSIVTVTVVFNTAPNKGDQIINGYAA